MNEWYEQYKQCRCTVQSHNASELCRWISLHCQGLTIQDQWNGASETRAHVNWAPMKVSVRIQMKNEAKGHSHAAWQRDSPALDKRKLGQELFPKLLCALLE